MLLVKFARVEQLQDAEGGGSEFEIPDMLSQLNDSLGSNL